MTANTGEFGVMAGELSTDELLHERMALHLGHEAAERFFSQLQAEQRLTHRAQHLVRAAELLEMFDEEKATAPKMQIVGTGASVEIPTKETGEPFSSATEVAEVAAEPLSADALEADVALERGESTQSLTEESNQATDNTDEKYEMHDEFRVDARVGILLDELAGEGTVAGLELTAADRDAVTQALMDVRGKIGPRGNPATFTQMLDHMYEGMEQSAIAESMGITTTALAQKWLGFRKRCIENAQAGLDVHTVIVDKIRSTILDERISHPDNNQPQEDLVGAGESVPIDRQGDQAVPTPVLAAEKDIEVEIVDFDEVLERFTQGYEAHRESIQALLSEDRFEGEGMNLGKNLLHDLMSKYASNRADARDNVAAIDEATYKVLRGLAGTDARGSNRMPRTLTQILKFERATDEATVLKYLAGLFDTALKDEYAIVAPVLRPSPTIMPRTTPTVVESSSIPMPEKVSANTAIDLFAVAKGEQKITKGEWNSGVDKLFEGLVERQVMKSSEVELLRGRIFHHHTDMDDVTRRILNMLQKRSSEPGSRIDEDPKVRDAFNMFTITALGGNGIEYIAQKLSRVYKQEVKPHTIERRVIGGIAAVLEP